MFKRHNLMKRFPTMFQAKYCHYFSDNKPEHPYSAQTLRNQMKTQVNLYPQSHYKLKIEDLNIHQQKQLNDPKFSIENEIESDSDFDLNIEEVNPQDITVMYRFFSESSTLNQIFKNYDIMKDQMNENNIFMVTKALGKIISNDETKTDQKLEQLAANENNMTSLFDHIINLIDKLSAESLVSVLRMIYEIKIIDQRETKIKFKKLLMLTKKQIDQLIQEAIDSQKQNQKPLIQCNLVAEIFFLYTNMKWNLYHIFHLVDRQIKHFLNQQMNQTYKISFTNFGISVILKACEKASSTEIYRNQKYADLAHNAQLAYFECNQKNTPLNQTLGLFKTLSIQQLHKHATANKIPKLLIHLKDLFLNLLDQNINNLSVHQILTIIFSYQFIPDAFDKTLLKKCFQYLEFYMQEKNKITPIILLIKILTYIEKLKKQDSPSDEFYQKVLDNIFSQLKQQVPMNDNTQLKLLRGLKLKQYIWHSDSNIKLLENYFTNLIQKDAFLVEIGNLLFQLGLKDIGLSKFMNGAESLKNEDQIWNLVKAINDYIDLFKQKFDQFDENLFNQHQQRVRDIQDPNLIFYISNRIFKELQIKQESNFLINWASEKLEQYWNQINNHNKLILMTNFFNQDYMHQKLKLFFETQTQNDIDVDQLEALSKIIQTTTISSPLPIQFFFLHCERIITNLISQPDLNKCQKVLNSIFNVLNTPKNNLLNRRGTLLQNIKLSLDKLQQLIQIQSQQETHLKINIVDLQKINRTLVGVNLGLESLLKDMIIYYLKFCLPNKFYQNKIQLFEYLELGELITETINLSDLRIDQSDILLYIDFNRLLTEKILENLNQLNNQSLAWQVKYFKIFLFLYYSPLKHHATLKQIKDPVALEVISEKLVEKIGTCKVLDQHNIMMDAFITLIKKDILQLNAQMVENQRLEFKVQSKALMKQLPQILDVQNGLALSKFLKKLQKIWNTVQLKKKIRPFILDSLNMFVQQYTKFEENHKQINVIIEFLRFMKSFKLSNKSVFELIIQDLKVKANKMKPSQITDCIQNLSALKICNDEFMVQISRNISENIIYLTPIELLDSLVALSKLGWFEQNLYEKIFEHISQPLKLEEMKRLLKKSQYHYEFLQGFWTFLFYLQKYDLDVKEQQLQLFLTFLESYEYCIINLHSQIQSPLLSRQLVDIFNYLDIIQIKGQDNIQNKINQVVIQTGQNLQSKQSNIDFFMSKQMINRPILEAMSLLESHFVGFTVNKFFNRKQVDVYIPSRKTAIIFENTIYVNFDQSKSSGFSIFNQFLLQKILTKNPDDILNIIIINEWRWNQMDLAQKLSLLGI